MRIEDIGADPMGIAKYIDEYSDVIPVRDKLDGAWGMYFLNDLPGDRAIAHAMGFIINQIVPTRMKRDNEIHKASDKGTGDRK